MIELKNISKKFKSEMLFEHLDVTLDKQKTKIKGINGVGKSVLLKIIVGYSIPNEGDVCIDGEHLRNHYDFIPSAGVSINAPQFIKSWSGYENLEYLRKIKNISTNNEMDELIRYFSLEKDIHKKYKTYSLGMQQKLRIIQSLLDKPRYLILDEPFDAIDATTKVHARELIQTYLNEDKQRMLIFTSHDERDNTFADELYEIDDKKIHHINA